MRPAQINAYQVHLTVANAFFGNHFLGELPNGLGWSLQAHRFEALVMVQMHVHGGCRQLMMRVVQYGQALGELTLVMVVDV
jgi:hypothetical protein